MAADAFYRRRLPIALAAFALSVALQAHGSSIGMWNTEVQAGFDVAGAHPILGSPRAIRTDEWQVSTPLALSQEFTGYSPVNDITRASPTNMLTVYSQPAWDLTALAKPFYWGYLLFGSSFGLSWFWSGRLIALLLLSFELFMILAAGRRLMALTAAMLVAFSPAVQWWFAVNFYVEMLCAGMLGVILIKSFLVCQAFWRKLLCSVLFALAGCAYALALYPAAMIPLAYLFAALAAYVAVKHWRVAPRSRKELLAVLPVPLVMGAVLGVWYLESAASIQAVMGTAYPGARVSTGGEAGWYVFAWVTNLFSPWSETANACEGAMFLGFFPVTEILAVAWLVSRRGRGMLMWLLVAVDALLITFSVAGLPAPLAQLLLLTPVSSNRAWLVVTLVEVFIYMHMLSSAGSREPDADAALARPAAKGTLGLLRARAVRIVAAVAALAALAVFLFNARASLPEFAVPFGFGLRSLALVGALAAVFAGLVLMAGHAKARGVAAAMLIALSLAAGATVNPLARTLDAITAKPLYAKVRAIEESSPGRWLATGSVGAEYLIAAGAATVNSTNILPALERWSVFDPGAAQDVYNRYAHINVSLTDGENRILPGASNDSFNVEVNGNGLSLLGVDYLCVFDGAPVPAAMLDCLEKIYDEHGVAIYLVASRPDMRRSS